ERIFGKTNGRCHVCRSQLSFNNYGKTGTRRAWEVEHSVPRAKGGTDHLNNLYASCIPCNRSKGSSTTRSARAKNGYTSAPLSKRKKMSNALTGGGVGLLATLLVPPHLRVAGAIFGAVVGAVIGHEVEPD
ncbi:MAG: HNH endonuclease, partial [Candidatus Thiodiazotropha endolucinida]